jgi:hypothetical protein
MDKKKIAVISTVCVILAVGAFFGFRQINKSKKTLNVSINELVDDKNNDVQPIQENVAVNQDKTATDNQPVSVPEGPSVIESKPTIPEKKTATTNDSKIPDKKDAGKIVSKLVSWGFQKSSGRTIKAIIIHTSYNNLGGDVFDFDKVIQEWKDAGVSPHYAIDRDGTTYQLVADNNIAWHAGASKLPDGTTDVNGASIGIEVINSQDAKFTDAQYAALNSLIANLKNKYPIKYVLGHDDIAPGRKTDPWGIDWGKVKR